MAPQIAPYAVPNARTACSGLARRDRAPAARDLSEHGKKEASFWYDFKFVNPATKKIQVKDQYCESLNQTVVCAGVYRP